MPVVVAHTELVGREDEIVQLREFVRNVGEAPRAVVVRGEAGIGKTTLWNAAVDEARAAGLTVLAARCVETELPLGLVGLSDLLQDVFSETQNDVHDDQRSALAVAIGLEAPHGGHPDGIMLSRAFLALLSALACKTSVLMARDDVQWLDEASRSVLSFAVRRLSELPVGVLVAQRGDDPDALDLARAFDERNFQQIRLGGLSMGSLAHLLRRRLDTRIPRPLLARLHAASGGNPMFALEFARRLAGQNRGQLGPLPFPTSLEDLVQTRVATFPPTVRMVLGVAAAVEKPTLALLRTVESGADSLLDAAVDAGAVVLDGGIVRFAHPLLASAAYADLAPSQRRVLHSRLAELAVDVEERARHTALASTEPKAEVAALLDEAAVHAGARGATDAAIELAQEAVRLTPAADASARATRAFSVARYLIDAGRHADAIARLDALLAAGLTGSGRARALLLAYTVEDDYEAAGRALAEALDHTGADLALRARVLLMMSRHLAYPDDADASEEAAREAVAAAEAVDEPALLASALLTAGSRAAVLGRPDAEQLLERGTAFAKAQGTERGWPTLGILLGERSLQQGDLRRAREYLRAELQEAYRDGREYLHPRVLLTLFEVERLAGNWEVAERYVDDLAELAVERGNERAAAMALVHKARLAALRGDVEHARTLLAQAAARGEAMHWPLTRAMNGWVVGSLELSLEEPGGAWAALEATSRTGPKHTLGLVAKIDAFADAVEALVGLGLVEDAEKLLARLDAEAQRGDLWAAPAVLRSRALILLAVGDAAAAAVAADEAAAAFEVAGFPLDRGRALLVEGDALRRQGERRRAGETLDAAKAIFDELGAVLWAERAKKELRRARPRPRRDRELTSAERRVAALVAAGRTNREVAAQLFTTVGTVEAHLTRIYRKLGVRSRTELTRGVADGTISVPDE